MGAYLLKLRNMRGVDFLLLTLHEEFDFATTHLNNTFEL